MALGVGGPVLARGRAVLEADTRNLDKGLDQAERRSKRAFGAMQKAALVGLGAIAGLAVKSIKAASDLGEQINKTSVVFGRAAGGIQAWAKTTAASIGISRRAALEAAGVFGNMLRPLGFAPDVAAKMSRRFVQLAADMASFNNASPQETLDALRAGLAGESEPLRRFGVSINQARIEAQALSSGLVKADVDLTKVAKAELAVDEASRKAAKALKEHGAGSFEARKASVGLQDATAKLQKAVAGKIPKLDAATKASATYALVLKDTKLQQGDFARTSDSLANQERILKAEFEDTAAKLGGSLLPAATRLMNLTVRLIGFTREHSTATKILVGVLGGMFAAIVLVNGAFTVYNSRIVTAIRGTQTFQKVSAFLNATLLANPYVRIALLIAALGTAIVIAYQKSETFRRIVHAVFNACERVVRTVVGGILRYISFWLGALEKVMQAASHLPFVGDKFKGIAKAIGGARDRVDELRKSIEGVKGKKVAVDVRFTASGLARGVAPPRDGDGAVGSWFGGGLAWTAAAAVDQGLLQVPGSGASPGGLSPWVRDELGIGRRMGLTLTSGVRPGATTSSGRPSLHGVGQAIDMAGSPYTMANYARAVAGRSGVAEVIYTPVGAWYPGVGWTRPSGQLAADHYDHVHVGVKGGDGLIGVGDGMHTMTGTVTNALSVNFSRRKPFTGGPIIDPGDEPHRGPRTPTPPPYDPEFDPTVLPQHIQTKIAEGRLYSDDKRLLEGLKMARDHYQGWLSRGGYPGDKMIPLMDALRGVNEEISSVEDRLRGPAPEDEDLTALPEHLELALAEAELTDDDTGDDLAALRAIEAHYAGLLPGAKGKQRIALLRALKGVRDQIKGLGPSRRELTEDEVARQGSSFIGSIGNLLSQYGSNIAASSAFLPGSGGGSNGTDPSTGQLVGGAPTTGGPNSGGGADKQVTVNQFFNAPPETPFPLMHSAQFAADNALA